MKYRINYYRSHTCHHCGDDNGFVATSLKETFNALSDDEADRYTWEHIAKANKGAGTSSYHLIDLVRINQEEKTTKIKFTE